jgi:hypothetical protein
MSATGAGNLVVVHIRTSNGNNVSSVTDDQGNTYVVGGASSLGDAGPSIVYQAYGVQVTGGVTTVTVNFSVSTSARAGADEYSGGATTNAAIADAFLAGAKTTGTNVSTTLNPAANGELVVATIGLLAARTYTAGTNYTMYNGTGSVTIRSMYNLNATTSETAPCTLSTSTDWVEVTRAYKPLAASSSVKQLALLGVG